MRPREALLQWEKAQILPQIIAAEDGFFDLPDPFSPEAETISPHHFYRVVDLALEFLLSPQVSRQESQRAGVSGMSRSELQAAVESALSEIVLKLKEGRLPQKKVLFGLSPKAWKVYGPLLAGFLDRLKEQVGMEPILVVISQDHAAAAVHSSVFLIAETPSDAAAALEYAREHFAVGKLQYLATSGEYQQMRQALRSREAPAIEQLPLETFPLYLQKLLFVVAGADPSLDQSQIDPFSGVDLGRLGEYIKELTRLGV